MLNKHKQLILSILLIGFSVSIINVFLSKTVLFLATLLLGIYVLNRYRKLDNYLFYILFFCTIIQLIAMIRFGDLSSHRFLSYAQFITRLLLSYFIIKIGGVDFLNYFEKLSFILILIGLPLFLLDYFYPESISWLKNFDIDSIKIQKENGGWNVFFYVHNAWAGFRFSGYSYEPGGMAMMIVLSMLIYILREGVNITFKVIVYLIALVLTFSTSGYIALFILFVFFQLNVLKNRFLILNILVGSVIFIYIVPFVWEQEFMRGKLTEYTLRHEKIISSESGYAGISYRNVGRISAAYVYLTDTFRWPIGHGTTTNGRTKNVKNEVVSGANSVFGFILSWGILGFLFYLHLVSKFLEKLGTRHNLRYGWILILPFLSVFATNSMLDAPIFYIFPMYSMVYLKDLPAFMNNKFIDPSLLPKR